MRNQVLKVKGMRDILPALALRLEHIRKSVRGTLELWGYQRIRTPALECGALYTSKVRSSSDVFNKEMFSLNDQQGNRLSTLRPENTASVVRAVTANNLLSEGPRRLWYDEPMFRRERNQKGRYRQFYQLGVEALGFRGIGIESELIVLGKKVLDAFVLNQMELRLNTIGTRPDRAVYQGRLIEYLSSHCRHLRSQSKNLGVSPLRILDSKSEAVQEVVRCCPEIYDSLGSQPLLRFSTLLRILREQAITFEISPTLVRGIDYYDGTVFEWNLRSSGQSLVAGGRYDSLVRRFGSDAGGCGWALGLERLEEASTLGLGLYTDVHILYANQFEWKIANNLRKELETANLVVVLRPRRNLVRTRGKALQLGSHFLIHMLPDCTQEVRSGTDSAACHTHLRNVASDVLGWPESA